jgi:von Willebrand factor type A domain
MRTLRLLSTLLILCASAACGISCAGKSGDTSLGTAGTSANGGTGGTSSIAVSAGMTGGNGGTSADSSTGGTEIGGVGGASDEGVPTCGVLTGLGTCGGTSVEAKLRTVNMLLLIDKSGSMTDPLGDTDKWTALKSALGTALGNVKSQMNFGLVMFPYAPFRTIPVDDCGSDCCDLATGSAAVLVSVSPGSIAVGEIGDELEQTDPGGGTPTAAALDSALDYFTNGDGAALEGDNYVLLATDGGPNCNDALTCTADTCTTNLDGDCDVGNCCQDADAHNLCLDDQSVITKLDALATAGISTFVVGLPGTQQYGQYLDEFAAAGMPDASDPHYYAVSESDGVEGLINVFESITTELVRSCTVTLDETPPQLDNVNVAIDCDIVPQDGSDGSGWDFDMVPNPTAVILRGPVCDRLQQDGAKRVDVVFGCPTVR